jgi:replication factor A1
MYGQIPPTTAERLKDVLQEGKVYVIRKFWCNVSRPSFRPVESPFMVQFTKFTTVEEQPGLEEDFPFCTYNLTAFADIPDPSNTRFIGQLNRSEFSYI